MDDIINSKAVKEKFLLLYNTKYADKMSFEDFEFQMLSNYLYEYDDKINFSDFLDLDISLDCDKKCDNVIDELNKKAHRSVQSVSIENRVLYIDVTVGIDSIINVVQSNDNYIDEVVLFADNANYDGLDKLKKLGKNIKVSYIHNEMSYKEPILLNEFLEMRKYINSVVYSIKEQHLTPVEEILALYEIIKWYRYNYNVDNPDDSRYIHSFVKTGNIVCAGYSKLFAQIAMELGHNAFVCLIDSSDTKTGIGHERNAIYVDDEYYNIKGLYYLDITFDSTQNDMIGNKYGDNVQKSNLFYQCFLFNFEQYKSLFPDEFNPVRVDNVDKILPYIQNDFVNMKISELVNEPKEINLPVIKSIYRNVMLKQKVNFKQIDEMLSDFDEHNFIQQQILKDNGSNSKGFKH